MCHIVGRGCAGIFLVAVASASCFAAAPADRARTADLPHLPGLPYSADDANRYFREASQFLARSGDSPHAPTVLHNIVMLAQLGRRDDVARDHQYLLVMKYPRSVPAMHVVAAMNDPADYRKLLRLHAGRSSVALSSKADAVAFCDAAELGMYRWGTPKFLDDDRFLLEVAVAAALADRPDVDRFLALLRQTAKPAVREIADLFFDPARSDLDKFAAIAALDEQGPAVAICHEALWNRLTADQRGQRSATIARAVHLCRQGDLADALRLLDRSPHDDPHLHYLRYWCAAAVGDADTATAALRALEQRHAASPWAKQAAQLSRRVGDIQANLAAHAELAQAAVAQLRDGPLGIEATAKFAPADSGFRYLAYIAFCPADRVFEVQLSDDRRTLLAYLAEADRTRLYALDDNATTQLPAAKTFPVFRWTGQQGDEQPAPRRGIGIRFDMADAEAYARSATGLLALPMLASAAGIANTLGDAMHSGYLPCTVEPRGDHTVAIWVRPDPRTGDLTEAVFEFDAQRRIAAVRTSQFHLESVHYRGDTNWRSQRPAWPQGPVQQRDEFDAAAFAKILGAVMQVAQKLGDDEPAEKTAAQRPPNPR